MSILKIKIVLCLFAMTIVFVFGFAIWSISPKPARKLIDFASHSSEIDVTVKGKQVTTFRSRIQIGEEMLDHLLGQLDVNHIQLTGERIVPHNIDQMNLLQNLTTLELRRCIIVGSFREIICENLLVIRLDSCTFTEETELENYSEGNHTFPLNEFYCEQTILAPADVYFLSTLSPFLSRFHVESQRIDTDFSRCLSKARSIKTLSMKSSDWEIGVLNDVSRLENISRLDLSHTALTDSELIQLLSSLPSLQELRIAGCPNISDHVLEEVRSHPKLSFVDLSGTKSSISVYRAKPDEWHDPE